MIRNRMPLPKLNLRDLFWLVVVVAMGLGWWMDRQSLRVALHDVELDRQSVRRKVDIVRAYLLYKRDLSRVDDFDRELGARLGVFVQSTDVHAKILTLPEDISASRRRVIVSKNPSRR